MPIDRVPERGTLPGSGHTYRPVATHTWFALALVIHPGCELVDAYKKGGGTSHSNKNTNHLVIASKLVIILSPSTAKYRPRLLRSSLT